MTDKIKISVIFPTRGRAKKCIECIEDLYAHASKPGEIEILLAVDNDDIESNKELEDFALKSELNVHIHKFERFPWPLHSEYHNGLVKHAKGDWIFGYGDDLRMQYNGSKKSHWDSAILSPENKDYLVLSPPVTPRKSWVKAPYMYQPIVRKLWVETLGFFAPHAYADGWCLDVVLKLQNKVQKTIFRMTSEFELYHHCYRHTKDKTWKDQTFNEMDASRKHWKVKKVWKRQDAAKGMRKDWGSDGSVNDAVEKLAEQIGLNDEEHDVQ